MMDMTISHTGLGGISVHPQYVRTYKDWVKETKERRLKKQNTRPFEDYIQDPNGDGFLNDSLTQTEWWQSKSRPGMDPEYSALATELALMENGTASYWATRITQPQFIRTTAEDYFPDWMNVFTKENGERIRSYDLVKGNEWSDVLWRGLGGGMLSLGNIAVGGLVGYGMLYVGLKLAEKNVDEVIEVPFVALSGLIKGTANLVGTVAKQFTKRGDAVAAFKDMPA